MNQGVRATLEYHKVIAMLADRTGSVMARELAESLEPVSDRDEVGKRLEETAEARGIFLTAVHVPLGGIRDIREYLQRAEIGAVLDTEELLAFGNTLYAARRVKTFFTEYDRPLPVLGPLVDAIIILRHLETAIDNTVNENGQIRDDASPELSRLRRDIRIFQSRVKEKLDHILHSSEYQKYFQDALVTVRGDRYVIPIKQECRHQFPGIVHDQSASGATVFIEPMAVVNLNNDIKQAMAAEKHEIERILRKISGQIAQSALAIRQTCTALAQIEFAFAKARLSIDMEAECPHINTQGYIRLVGARHPLIDKQAVVPIDVELGKDFTTLLITGPNTGGKTVSLKTVGLFALMIQAGLFIPAKSTSEMTIFNGIFADIGDEQSIEHSLSTFSSHMTNLVRILSHVGSGDLVLVDEIGAGTDPGEGAALAMAILEHLLDMGVRTIATTHYNELKSFAYSRRGIENASVEFDIATLRPTYRLLIGVPGSSNAFNISLRLGLGGQIIERARSLMDKEHVQFETVLAALDAKQREYANRSADVAAVQQEMAVLQERFRREKTEWDEKKRAMLAKAQEQAASLIRQARHEAEAVIAELKEQFSVQNEHERQQSIVSVRRRLSAVMGSTLAVDADDGQKLAIPDASQLEPGTTVLVATLAQKGIVQAVANNQVTVQLGIMKVNVPIADCRLIADPVQPPRVSSKKAVDVTKVQTISAEVDLRGMTVTEAEETLDKYLDDALLAGLSQVRVIHGKGTGSLRKGVKPYLVAHRSIKDIRLGEAGEGGDGVTVVTLK